MDTIPYTEAAIPGHHTIEYTVRDGTRGNPTRTVDVLATSEEIQLLAQKGYLVRHNLLPSDQIERLRTALDETVARDNRLEKGGGKAFGGVFIRHLMDKHPAFLEFLHFAPTVSDATPQQSRRQKRRNARTARRSGLYVIHE